MQKLSLAGLILLAVACRGGEEKRGVNGAPQGGAGSSGSAGAANASGAAVAGSGAAAAGGDGPTAAVGSATGVGSATADRSATADDGHSADDGHDHSAHDGHDRGAEEAPVTGAPEVEQIPTAKVVELAGASVRKMEELSQRAAAAKGVCPKLAVALDGFYRENAAFIAEMNGLDDKMTKLQRKITDEQFTAPMQKAMSTLLNELMACRDDPAVAKAFLQLQK